MIKFSDITLERWKRFRALKRSWYSFLILSFCYVFSLTTPWLANDKPLLLSYNNELYFPAFTFYSQKDFAGTFSTEMNYLDLEKEPYVSKVEWSVSPLIPHDPLHSYLDEEGAPPYAPSSKHWLGSDASGRDILSRLAHGFRICMSFALFITILSTILGILLGGIQGYFGGKIDLILQRITEVWSSLPFLYVVILMGAIYGRSFGILILVMSLFSWIGLSYYMRGEFFKIKTLTYVKSAKSLGLSQRHIFFKEILPNALTPVITILPFSIIGGISSLTALDFLGFGLQPPTPSWGELLSQGLAHLYAPWIAISSVVGLFITLLLATFVGEGVREAFDPKSERS